MSDGIVCCKLDCKKYAVWRPVFLLFPPENTQYKGDPIRCTLDLPLCDDHKENTLLQDLLSDEGWIQLCDAVKLQGRIEPERLLTQLSWEKIIVTR